MKRIRTNARTANGRFGTMAAVIPQTILWEFARYYPAASSVEAATAPSRFDVSGKRQTAQRENEVKNLKMNSEMKKFLILLLLIGLSPIIGGIYGILNDQLTYTISPEYYTKFKFYQFGLIDLVNSTNPRIGASVVGFLATWWVGLPIGIILGLVGLIHKKNKQMFSVILRAIFVTVIVAFAIGLIGLAYGKLYLADTGVNWWLPDNLIDTKNFIAVGSMHNFSYYFGGPIGVIAGVIYSVRQKREYATTNTDGKNASR